MRPIAGQNLPQQTQSGCSLLVVRLNHKHLHENHHQTRERGEFYEQGFYAKNKLVSRYRENLPNGAQILLLLFSRPTVAGSVPIPHGMRRYIPV
jgi:hypothetical protein